MLSFRNTVAQWEIYDSYMGEYSAQVWLKNQHESQKSWQEPALDTEVHRGSDTTRNASCGRDALVSHP